MRVTRLFTVLMVMIVAGSMPLAGADAAVPRAEVDVDVMAQRYVFVINRVGARWDALVNLRSALESFSREALRAGDQVMIVEIGYTTRVLQEFTDSQGAILEALGNLSMLPIRLQQRVATRQLYESLDAVAAQLEQLPGRKAIVLASSEPNVIRQGVHYVRATAEALNMANASVYSLDLDIFRRPFRRSVIDSGLAGLASGTGGHYFYTRSRIGFLPALYEVAEEMSLERAAVTDF